MNSPNRSLEPVEYCSGSEASESSGRLLSQPQPQPQQPPEDSESDHEYGANLPLEEDELSGEIREYTGTFEGPEKTLEVMFRKAGMDGADDEHPFPGKRVGLRKLHRRDLDKICQRARCTILSCMSNQFLDAYVLSESSLFVYPYMLVLKTCGTTTLLRCVAVLIELGRRLGLEIDWVGYSRKNFNFPIDQGVPSPILPPGAGVPVQPQEP